MSRQYKYLFSLVTLVIVDNEKQRVINLYHDVHNITSLQALILVALAIGVTTGVALETRR